MPMKLASIDIGTNSTRLLIAEYKNGKFTSLVRKMAITRIGRNLDRTGGISGDSAEKTLEVLSGYKQLMKEEKVSKYKAIGTSALRQASNSDWFISYICEKLGMQVEVVSGDREADLSFTGAVRDIDIGPILYRTERFSDGNRSRSKVSYRNKSCCENVLVVDVGGGSSEFILGSSYSCSVILTESIDLGCVRLTEKFINSNPPPIDDLNNMRVFIRKELKNTIEKIKKNGFSFIIGLAGTITTLAAIDLNLREYSREKIHHHILSLGKIKQIYKNLCSLSLQERKKVIGLEPERADVIIGGTAVVLEMMELLEENSIVVSENDILNGIIYSLADF